MSAPATMKAILVEGIQRGRWNRLVMREVKRPRPAAGEALVRVEAASVNRADLLQRRGLYPPPEGASEIPGLDFAGVVEDVSPDTDLAALGPGDRVFGIAAGGGYGRYLSVPADHLLPVPELWNYVQAAAAAEVFIVAYLNLFVEAGLEKEQSVLVHGGSGGVGTAAIQLGREMGLRVIVTAGSEEKLYRCRELGAFAAVKYKDEDWPSQVLEATGGEGLDAVLDCVGAPYLPAHLKLLKNRGKLVLIGLMGGHSGEIQLAPVLTRRLRILGSVLRSRRVEEKTDLIASFWEDAWPLLDSGQVGPVIDRVFSIEEAEDAHLYMREGDFFGKIVLSWEDAGE